MELNEQIIASYNKTRQTADKNLLCHAPFVNLNFEQNGHVRACCYNTKHILGKWPAQSIKEIWFGEKADELRNYIRGNDLGGGCSECGKMLQAGNFHGIRARYYDEYAAGKAAGLAHKIKSLFGSDQVFPRVMEFELSNQCNLECVMCNGYFSSSIRKNRENLPPISSPYNSEFVDQLEEFIPHLTDAKFLGGEPFMIDVYLEIWERILKIKPGIRIHITTNGTFLNKRIKDLLEGLNAGIILSCDSVNEETYSKIRINGQFKRVMENLEYFRDYTSRKNTFLSMAACPITYNWKELPEMLNFCIEKNITLYFNAVFSPDHLSLRSQSADYLHNVIEFLEAKPLQKINAGSFSPPALSIRAYSDFLHLLRGWHKDRLKVEAENSQIRELLSKQEIQTENERFKVISRLLERIISLQNKPDSDILKAEQNALLNLMDSDPWHNIHAFILICQQIYLASDGQSWTKPDQDKTKDLARLIAAHPNRRHFLEKISSTRPVEVGEFLFLRSTSEFENTLSQFL